MADHKHYFFNDIASLRMKQLYGQFGAQIINYINVNYLITQDTHGQSITTTNPKVIEQQVVTECGACRLKSGALTLLYPFKFVPVTITYKENA